LSVLASARQLELAAFHPDRRRPESGAHGRPSIPARPNSRGQRDAGPDHGRTPWRAYVAGPA